MHTPLIRLVALAVCSAASFACMQTPAASSGAAATATSPARSRVAIAKALPALDGAHLTNTVVEVQYGPGESSAAHSHPCPVIGYVIEGAIRTRAGDEPEVTYRAGETFYEAPNGVHALSANASTTDRARFLAFFTCDHEAPLSSPVTEAGR